MTTPLHVLLLEDNHADALLIVRALRQAGFEPTWSQVMDEESYRAALEPPPELILADYTLPQYDALRALDLLVEQGLDIPFIIVSGTIDEEMAVSTMQRGAADYLLKDRLTRLGMAVVGALQRQQLRVEQQRSLSQMRDNERRFRALVEHSADGIMLLDRHGVFQYVSPAAERITGFPLEDFVAADVLSFIHPRDHERVQHLMTSTPNPLPAVELRVRHRDGSWRWIEAIPNNLLNEPAVGAIVINYRDITARLQAEEELRQYANNLAALHEMERRARLQAETLRRTNLALTHSLDLEAVLGAIFSAIARLVPYDRALMILLQDGETRAVYCTRGGETPHVEVLPINHLEDSLQFQELISSGESVLVTDVRSDTQRAPHDWLGVPLRLNGMFMGVCALETRAGTFSEDHLRWVEAVAAQAAVAIENARLFDEVGRAHARLQVLSHELIRAHETERRGLAREIHDEVGQVLVALQLNLRRMQESHPGADSRSRIDDSIQLVDRLIQQVRSLTRELRPPLLDDLGLVAALTWHIDGVAERADLEIKFHAQLGDQRLPAELEISVFRIVQEALNNVVKHAQARHVRVELRREDAELRVSIIDDGHGFDTEAVGAHTTQRTSLGLISMHERALLANGSTEIVSAPEAGTCVRARFVLQ